MNMFSFVDFVQEFIESTRVMRRFACRDLAWDYPGVKVQVNAYYYYCIILRGMLFGVSGLL